MEAFVRDLAVPHFLIICSRDCLTRLAVSQGMIDSSNSLRKCRSRSDHPDLRAVFLVGQAVRSQPASAATITALTPVPALIFLRMIGGVRLVVYNFA